MTYLAAGSASSLGNVVSGTLGFLVVAGMGLALFFLLRSMNKHLRKVVREPRWREEAQAGQDAPQDQAEQDYSQNGSPQA